MAENNNHHDDDYTGHDEGGGFSKGTNYRWLIIGGIVFALMTWVMPIPESMIDLAISRNQGDQLGVKTAMEHLFGEDVVPNTVRTLVSKAAIDELNATQIKSLATKGKQQQAAMGLDVPGAKSEHFKEASALMMQISEEELTKAGQIGNKAAVELTLDSLTEEQEKDVRKSADHMKTIIALLTLCVIFFATEAIPLPAVALIIGLVQLFFGITPFQRLVGTYAHDAVWFIAGALAIGVTFVKFGLDKRVGMFMIKISGSSTRGIVAGLLVCTSIPTAFVGEHIIATMFLPIAIAIYTLSKRKLDSPNLGKLLMMTIAFGCMIGGPASPTGGARNAIMIGFLSDYFGIEVSFIQWVKMGIIYTLVMIPLFAFILPLIFKPEQRDLSYAVDMLKQDLAKHGKITRDQLLVAGILLMVILLWITDKSIVHSVLGFSLGLGGIAIFGSALYMIFGFTTWKDYEEGVSWGVIILYAGAISLGNVFKATGASEWLAQSVLGLLDPLGITSGPPLAVMVSVVSAGMTNLMSAGATVAVLGPVVLNMAQISGTSPLIIGIATAMGSSTAFWLVVGTPANAIVYSSGILSAGDFIKAASFTWVLALLVIALIILFYWGGVLGLS